MIDIFKEEIRNVTIYIPKIHLNSDNAFPNIMSPAVQLLMVEEYCVITFNCDTGIDCEGLWNFAGFLNTIATMGYFVRPLWGIVEKITTSYLDSEFSDAMLYRYLFSSNLLNLLSITTFQAEMYEPLGCFSLSI